MRIEEFAELRSRIPESDEHLADQLGVPAERLRAWRAGTERIPRFEARLVRFLAASAERGRALEESGLQPCAWMVDFDAAELPDDLDAMEAELQRAEQHHATCAQCLARERFIDERFGPMPPYPMKGWMSVFALFERLPSSLRPAALGASALAAIVSFRVLFAVPAIIAKPALTGELLLAVLAAAAAGASGGLAFTAVRPAFKRLGRPGDYLTGIVCVGAYLTSIMLVAPIAFGKSLMTGPAAWFSLAFTTLLFGLIIGHSWFGPSSDSAKLRAGAS